MEGGNLNVMVSNRSPWSFRGKLHEEHKLFFDALARETKLDSTVFTNISHKLVSKYLRSTLHSILQLTTLQMRDVIMDCGGSIDWLTTIEDMLGSRFARSVEEATTVAVVAEKNSKGPGTSFRVSKFLDQEEQTLGRELLENNQLNEAVLPGWVFEVVKTPEPERR